MTMRYETYQLIEPIFDCRKFYINGIEAKSDEVPIFAKDVAAKKIVPEGVGGRIYRRRLIEFSIATVN